MKLRRTNAVWPGPNRATSKAARPGKCRIVARHFIRPEGCPAGCRADDAAAALIAGDKAAAFKEGIAMAAAAVDSGKALQKLEEFIDSVKILNRGTYDSRQNSS